MAQLPRQQSAGQQSASVYSRAFNEENRQQGKLEIVQSQTLLQRDPEGIVGLADVRHSLEGRAVDLIERESFSPPIDVDMYR
jgi:hypothetical protein